MAATDPQSVVFWDEDAGPRLFFSGHWYRFQKKIEVSGAMRWVYAPEKAPPPLTDEQKFICSELLNNNRDYALMSGKFQEHDVAFICAAALTDKEACLTPVAILVDATFAEQFGDVMTDPLGNPLPKEKT